MCEKPTSPLRQRMLEDMSVGGFVPNTQMRVYLSARKADRMTIGLERRPAFRARGTINHIRTYERMRGDP